MLRSRQIFSAFNAIKKLNAAAYSDSATPVDTTYMEIPVYNIDKPQTLEKRKARHEEYRRFCCGAHAGPAGQQLRTYELQYQSRKRGMLENDLLLSTFAKKYLDGFNEEQTIMYDRLINSPSNDWDIFHWIVQKTETPEEFDNEIMDLLKKHAKNDERIVLNQPDLY